MSDLLARNELSEAANQNPEAKKEESRYSLAKMIVQGYMVFIGLAFLSPFATYLFIGIKVDNDIAPKIMQILNSYMGALSGFTGLVGFVIGYYFKGTEAARDG